MDTLLSFLLSPLRLIFGPIQWFRQASLAARLAFLFGVFQIVIVLLATSAVLFAGEWVVLQLWWSPGKIFLLLLLFISVPILVYRSALLWCEIPTARWPDVTSAWNTIIQDLKRQDVDLEEWPVYLVLGSDGNGLESALFHYAATPLLLSGSPGAGAPLHAYATKEAVYITLNSIGHTAAAAKACRNQKSDSDHQYGRKEEASRLDALCSLLAMERAPFVPINGILSLVQVDYAHLVSQPLTKLAIAQAQDFQRITHRLGVRAPVTFLAVGLENEAGFADYAELLSAEQQPKVNADQTVSKPTGREEAKGVRFPVGIRPTNDQLTAVAANAMGPLTDNIAEMVLDPARLPEQQRRIRLVELLCRIRLHGASQLNEVLQQVFSNNLTTADLPLLSGAFAGALGPEPEKQGFLAGVLSHLNDQQAELDWTRKSLRSDERARRAARILFGLTMALLLLSSGMLWWNLVA